MKFDILAQFIASELGRAQSEPKSRNEHEKAQLKSRKREFLDVRALLGSAPNLSSDERIYAAPMGPWDMRTTASQATANHATARSG